MYGEERKAAEFILHDDERVLWAERRAPRWNARRTCAAGLLVIMAGGLVAAFAAGIINGLVLYVLKLLQLILRELRSFIRMRQQSVYIFTPEPRD